MTSRTNGLLGELLEWHNKTPTVVRVDLDDPFISQIVGNQEAAEKLNNLIKYYVCDNYNDLDKLLKSRDHRILELLELEQRLEKRIESLNKTEQELGKEEDFGYYDDSTTIMRLNLTDFRNELQKILEGNRV